MLPEITPAHIALDADGTPFASDFGDRYFSRENGLAETRHVFLGGNQLPSRWQNQPQFIIAETGFGTGLNFLATWQAWDADPERCHTLHYLSIEKHPIPALRLGELLQAWPELASYSQALLAQYPPPLAGFHHLSFANHRVRLTLCFADVQDALGEWPTTVDAWYLDGFSPALNGEMWTAPVLQRLAQHSRMGTTLASFTVAGQVRRNVAAAGFHCEKRPGFGQKREMLTAHLPEPRLHSNPAPWFALPQPLPPTRTATVIGAGIAGCQIAQALAIRGWQVTVLEREARIAQQASGNRAGVLTPKLTAEPDWGERFYRQAFLFAIRQLQQLAAAGLDIEWQACGALQLNHNPSEHKRWQALHTRGLPTDFLQLPDALAASTLAGIPLTEGGSYFPQGGWLYPASLCSALCQHPNIQVRTNTTAIRLEPCDLGWSVLDAHGMILATSAIVVLAHGKDIASLPQSSFLPFTPVRGQTSQGTATPYTAQLKVTLGHEGYLTPAIAGQHLFGATFERDQHEAILDSQADHTNQQQLANYLPDFAQALGTITGSHCAIRMTTPDRYPCVGALPDLAQFQGHYAGIRHGRTHQAWPDAPYQTGFFISGGYGSRGLTTSGLCSEMLAAIINREPLPIEKGLYYKLHPARFLLRRLQQKRD